MLERSTLCLVLAAVLGSIAMGCSSSAEPAAAAPPNGDTLASAAITPGHAPVSPFAPPAIAGCAGATAYDLCFAWDGATPLAVVVQLPEAARPQAIASVHFRRDDGVNDKRVLDGVKFPIAGAKRELHLYFQVYPGSYRIEVSVDTDGDGNPEGPGDLVGWSSESREQPVLDEARAALVDVATAPIEASFALAPRL
jgi:hypothetical protein